MTVAAFYAKQAIEGRAVLVGRPESPDAWLSRAQNRRGEISYWRCESASCVITPVDPVMEVSRLSRFVYLGGRPSRVA